MRWCSFGLKFGLCLMLLAGCSSSGSSDSEPDAGGSDGGEPDGTPDAAEDGGDIPNESAEEADHDLWGWCPDASAYVGGEWNNSAVVTDEALFCVVNQGLSVEEAMRNKAQLRIVAGTYPLPDTDGTYSVLIPACIWTPRDDESQHMDVGMLTVATRNIGNVKSMRYELIQPMQVGDRQWYIVFRAMLYIPGDVPPQIVIGSQLNWQEENGDVTLYYDLSVESFEQPWSVYPCEPAEFNKRETLVDFDRGNLAVDVDLYIEAEYGGQGPAIFRRGQGELDGVSFEQQAYDRLAHLPAHHNWGGIFLVLFDEPIGLACGIKLEVPSMDGGGPSLGAWTVDCDLAVIDELEGLVVVQP